MMVVAVEAGPAFKFNRPERLFRGTYYSLIGYQWDLSPDGKRFLMIKEAQATGGSSPGGAPRRINIVLNWFEELKQRVPVK